MSRKIEKKRWKTRHKLEEDSRYPDNCIHIGRNESYKHAKKKLKIAWELIQDDKKIVTEAKAKNKNRIYDIICLDTGNIYEIESDKSVEKKDADFTIYLD